MMITAESALKGAIKRRALRAAVLKAADAWQALYDQMRDAYTRAWSDAMRSAIADGLDTLRDLGNGAFTAADGDLILSTLKSRVGGEAMAAAVRGPVINLSGALGRLGAQEVGAAAGIDITFMRPDLEALKLIQDSNLFWVENHWNAYTQQRFRAALTTYFRDGMTREQLAARFAEDFAGLTKKGQVYWELLADHTATKTRELGRLPGYEQAGAEFVQIRAHIDDNTTEKCRNLHGKIIPVSKMRTQRDRYLEAIGRRDAATAKEAWSMDPDPGRVDIAADKLPENEASPPYHFRCRTITVAYFPSA